MNKSAWVRRQQPQQTTYHYLMFAGAITFFCDRQFGLSNGIAYYSIPYVADILLTSVYFVAAFAFFQMARYEKAMRPAGAWHVYFIYALLFAIGALTIIF